MGEVQREIDGIKWREQREHEEKAYFDYIEAQLIGISVSRLFSSSSNYPKLHEVYPTIFKNDPQIEEENQQKTDISVIRFLQFAELHNQKFNKRGE